MLNKNKIKKIIYLGPQGTYCELAKNKFCAEYGLENCEQNYLMSIKSIIEAVDNMDDCAAVLPIENSIEGNVRETTDNLLRTKDSELKICAETIIDINHCLISKAKSISSIKKIISHPQALAQCQNFLHNIFSSDIEMIECGSTSKAVQALLGLDNSYAAIANEKAAQNAGLNILYKNINDEPDNQTRFILISRCPTCSTGEDKTSMAFGTKNESGSLIRVLDEFDKFGINLTYISSRPSKKNLGEYVFFVDFEGHIDDEIIKTALNSIKKNTIFIKILGSYTKK